MWARNRPKTSDINTPAPVPPVGNRTFSTSLPPNVIGGIQNGVLRTVYRGVPTLKSPFDIMLYLQLLHALAPRTVFEIGSKYGGSALWFADMLRASHIDGRVISVDLESTPEVEDPAIEFRRGDALALGAVISAEELATLPRPFLVVEDSAHFFDTTLAVLEFFHPHLQPGEYIVIEDGILSSMDDPFYERYEHGPNRAVAAFLEAHPAEYEIDAEFCDLYGPNVTWSPNGWLRRR